MNLADFFLGSIPLLIQFYVEMFRETDLKNTMHELESEFNVPKVQSYDFIIGKLIFFMLNVLFFFWVFFLVTSWILNNFFLFQK